MSAQQTEQVIRDLSDFDRETREKALSEIAGMVKAGKIERAAGLKSYLNLHIHTFHSYNYNNWSPARVVFEGWRTGLEYTGTVDFDTIAGLEETLLAGSLLDIKVISGFESRVFIEEMKDRVINSPNEPGIYYLCGKGFKKAPAVESEEGRFFIDIKETAQRRNRQVIDKLNGYLKEVRIDYERDVLPLTPSDNPTERHIVEAYQKRSEEVLDKRVDRFWAGILNISEEEVCNLRTQNTADFQEALRKKLIKYGGPGYVLPEKENFPLFDRVVQMIEKAGGIPTGTWLDGTNPGEENPAGLLEFLQGKGIRVIDIIPDRNYNIINPKEKEIKVKNLNEFMDACKKVNMPVVCGTEMNKHGQPFVDDFTNPALSPHLSYFLSSVLRCFDTNMLSPTDLYI
jgi:hypothetical protein